MGDANPRDTTEGETLVGFKTQNNGAERCEDSHWFIPSIVVCTLESFGATEALFLDNK